MSFGIESEGHTSTKVKGSLRKRKKKKTTNFGIFLRQSRKVCFIFRTFYIDVVVVVVIIIVVVELKLQSLLKTKS